MKRPPGNEKGALLHAPIPKLTAVQDYHRPVALQVAVWQRESNRLLSEFLRTGRFHHWRAWAQHVLGMASRLEGGYQ
jgi:hypothetical protein